MCEFIYHRVFSPDVRCEEPAEDWGPFPKFCFGHAVYIRAHTEPISKRAENKSNFADRLTYLESCNPAPPGYIWGCGPNPISDHPLKLFSCSSLIPNEMQFVIEEEINQSRVKHYYIGSKIFAIGVVEDSMLYLRDEDGNLTYFTYSTWVKHFGPFGMESSLLDRLVPWI